jgi:membrane protein YqaA with SNARE-associated domain
MPTLPARYQKLISVLIFIGSLALSISVLFLKVDTRQLAAYGYGGIFVITLLGALSLFIPGPTLLAAFLIGSVLNPFWVSVVAGLGSALGETTGYAAGYSSRSLLSPLEGRSGWYRRLAGWITGHPFLTLFFLSAIPNFLTDLGGLWAGRSGYAYPKFLLATFLGKCVRFALGADLGAYFGPALLRH